MRQHKRRVNQLIEKSVELALDDNQGLATYILALNGDWEAARLLDSLAAAAIATGRTRYRQYVEIAQHFYEGREDKAIELYEELQKQIKAA